LKGKSIICNGRAGGALLQREYKTFLLGEGGGGRGGGRGGGEGRGVRKLYKCLIFHFTCTLISFSKTCTIYSM
jgi:hypothetical protein